MEWNIFGFDYIDSVPCTVFYIWNGDAGLRDIG